MRDLRDPRALGLIYLRLRGMGLGIDEAVQLPAQNYWDGKWMSSDPADHHSKTPQNIGDLHDGA